MTPITPQVMLLIEFAIANSSFDTISGMTACLAGVKKTLATDRAVLIIMMSTKLS